MAPKTKSKKAHPSLHPHRGWRPDHLDPRDLFAAPPSRKQVANLPAKVSLRNNPLYPACYDQQQEGACTQFSTGFLLHWREIVLTGTARPVPAFNFGYYNTRVLEGTVHQDSGATNRLALKAAARWGYCADDLWPYAKKTMFTKPARKAYAEAAKHELKNFMYLRLVQDAAHFKACLAQGVPHNIGFNVYESFRDVGKNGRVAMPDPSKEQFLGGHSVALIGYDDSIGCWEMRNSWGTDIADAGHYWVPYDYFVNAQLASDPWAVQNVPTPDAES